MQLHKYKMVLWLISMLLATGVFAQMPDPIIGTWELNLAKSKYGMRAPPKSHTRTYVLAGDEIEATSKTVEDDGRVVAGAWSFSVNYDGKERPMSGFDDGDSLIIKRVDARTFAVTQKKAGKVVGTGTRVMSADGKTMTITYTYPTGGKDGKPYTDVEVFDKR